MSTKELYVLIIKFSQQIPIVFIFGRVFTAIFTFSLPCSFNVTVTFGMAAHPDNRHGSKNYPNDPHPWYNMPMIFYFKGRKEDVKQYQQKVETPNKKELAMLVKKREDAKDARLAKKMMEK